MDQTIQQQRAKYALTLVNGWLTHSEPKKLKARSAELPTMIHCNGLGQALAFFQSKGEKDGYAKVLDGLQKWLTGRGRPLEGHPDALTAIIHCNMNTYRQAQAEAIQIMDWVKKFAAAKLDDK